MSKQPEYFFFFFLSLKGDALKKIKEELPRKIDFKRNEDKVKIGRINLGIINAWFWIDRNWCLIMVIGDS